jgi:hypothetical protein
MVSNIYYEGIFFLIKNMRTMAFLIFIFIIGNARDHFRVFKSQAYTTRKIGSDNLKLSYVSYDRKVYY